MKTKVDIKPFTFWIETKTYNKLREMAYKKNSTIASLIRQAVGEMFLKEAFRK